MTSSKKPKVLVAGIKVDAWVEEHFEKLRRKAEIHTARETTTEVLLENARDAEVIIVRSAKIPKEIIENTISLRGIVKWGVGVDNIAIEAATRRGVVVTITPVFLTSVAEANILLMMALAKNLLRLCSVIREGRQVDNRYRGIELKGKTIGIVGLGRIGSDIARIARGLRMKILTYDPYVNEAQAKKFKAKLVDLKTLLMQSDFVSLNCPLTDETYHLIGKEELNLMKRTAYLINTARGAIVDEKALYEALKNRTIAGAGLDVFEEEPVRSDNPLLRLDNVIATPHFLGATWDGFKKVAEAVQDAALKILKGKVPKYVVNPEILNRREVR